MRFFFLLDHPNICRMRERNAARVNNGHRLLHASRARRREANLTEGCLEIEDVGIQHQLEDGGIVIRSRHVEATELFNKKGCAVFTAATPPGEEVRADGGMTREA